jgi:hypothetical protein
MRELRPNWTARTPRGAQLTVEYDTLRRRWRVDPGGYERRQLADALGQATGDAPASEWITTLTVRLTDEIFGPPGHTEPE